MSQWCYIYGIEFSIQLYEVNFFEIHFLLLFLKHTQGRVEYVMFFSFLVLSFRFVIFKTYTFVFIVLSKYVEAFSQYIYPVYLYQLSMIIISIINI